MTLNLTASLLLSTPSIGDPRFQRSVVFLCAHSAEGAFGLVLNRPIPGLRLGMVLEQIGIEIGPDAPARIRAAPVLGGGPVEAQRGFVLHRDDGGGGPAAQALPGGLALSASTEVLGAIARGQGPSDWLLALGYAGWAAGQLEAELAQNAWLTRDADADLVFSADRGEGLWLTALRGMGIDPLGLSAQSGRA